jgi:hypothetical protein
MLDECSRKDSSTRDVGRRLDELLRDAVTDDGQEADLAAGAPDLRDDRPRLARDVDHRHGHVA